MLKRCLCPRERIPERHLQLRRLNQEKARVKERERNKPNNLKLNQQMDTMNQEVNKLLNRKRVHHQGDNLAPVENQFQEVKESHQQATRESQEVLPRTKLLRISRKVERKERNEEVDDDLMLIRSNSSLYINSLYYKDYIA